MRAIHFMKIDYIRTKQQIYFLPLFCLLALIMDMKTFPAIVAFSYMAFIAMSFSTAPFGTCRAKDAGFLLLLPSTTKDRVLGRFLYGMSYVGMAVLMGGILLVIEILMGEKMEAWMLAAALIILAVCILVTSLEILFLYLAGEHVAPSLLGIARTIPGMALFFFAMWFMGKMEDGYTFFGGLNMTVMSGMSGELAKIGAIAIAAALVVLAVSIAVCIKVTEKRDYA